MSTDRDFTRIVRSWMDEGVTALPDHVLDSVLDQLPATPQRRSMWLARRFPPMSNAVRIALAAAAVVVVALLGYQLLIAPNITNPVPSPSPSVAPSATTPTSEAAIDMPGAGTLRPGTYVLDHFPVPLIFETTSDFFVGTSTANAAILLSPPATADGRAVAFFIVDNVYADPCDSAGGELDPPLGPSVQDLVTALSNAPGIEATSPGDVTVGEFQGTQIDVTGAAPGVPCPNALAWRAGDHRRDFSPGEEGRLIVVEADGTRILINTATPSQVDAAVLAEIQHTLDSLRLQR